MADPRSPTVDVVCLCAAWCRLCDEYASVLRAVTAEFDTGHTPLRVRWIDIEDEAELIGDLDVETFPTLLVIGPDGLRFAGPLTPQPDTLRRLLRSTVLQARPGDARPTVDPAMQALAERLITGSPKP